MATHNNSGSVLPIQKLPLSKKDKEWRESNLDYWIGVAALGGSDDNEMKIKYDLYNSKFHEKDIEYVVDPYKTEEGFPASPQNYNVIKPKVDLLLGEESKRPDRFKVIQTNRDRSSAAEEQMKKLLFQSVVNDIRQEGARMESMNPDDIQDYIEQDFSDIAEMTAQGSLEYLKSKLNIKDELLKGFKDAMIAGREIYYVGVINGEPIAERVNPIGLYYDKSPDIDSIEDGDFAIRHMSMSPAAIYDRFYDLLKDSDYLDRLMELSGGQPSTGAADEVNYNKVVYRTNLAENPKELEDSFTTDLDVYHVTWKSYKKIGFLTYIDESGEEIEETVDETYKLSEEDKEQGAEIRWEWVTEVWEGYKIGTDIYVGVEPIPNQEFSIEEPSSNKLPYVGSVYNDDNSESTSLVDIMKPLQYMYIIIWYRLELAMAQNKGRVLNMDITQIPKSQGLDIQSWLHYLSSFGVNFINPYEEGWDVPGREGGNPASFNQMSSVDLTMSKVVGEYIQLLDKIEEMIGELSGISRQRQGSISQRELVGNVERSVIQSSHVTEPLFWKHNTVKRRVYTALLNTAKIAWADSDKQKLQFAMDDMRRSFINITEDFQYADFDVFVSDSSDEYRKIQVMQNPAETAIGQGATLSEVSEMLKSSSIPEMNNKLKEIDAARQKAKEQSERSQQQSELRQLQMELEQKYNEDRINEEDSIRKARTDIEVALIGSEDKQADSGYKSELEMQEADLKAQEARMKEEKIEEEKRQNRVQEELKERELDLKSKQMQQQKQNRNS